MTFNTLELALYRKLNYGDSPATAVKTRVDAALNDRHRQILSRPGLSRLREDNTALATVASQAVYALGPNVARIKTVYNTTNQRKLIERSVEWVRTIDPGLVSSGSPEVWVPLSVRQVQQQPPAACDLHVISTSASDTTTTTCYVEYTRTGGYRASASHTLNGTSDVALTSTTDVIEVDKFYLSAPAVGTVTLLDGVAGRVLATIPPGQGYARYLTVQFWPTPAAVYTVRFDYTREIADMANATDEPLLPVDFHYLVWRGALIDEYEKQTDGRLAVAQAEWERGISRLQDYVLNSPDFIVIPGGELDVPFSNLGGQYPAQGWF